MHESADAARESAEPFPSAAPSPFAALIGRRAAEGCPMPGESGVRFIRLSQRARARKQNTLGPTLSIVGQGAKSAQFGPLRLRYDSQQYLLITGESAYDVEVLEASPARPHLEVAIDIPIELVIKTLLAMAAPDADDDAPAADAPAFVAPLDATLTSTLERLLVALDDPLERRILVPLVMEELVFHLLRSDAAATLRRAAGGRDARAIHDAMRFMRLHYRDPLAVGDLARAVGMSASHFAHRFRAVAGQTPMRYLKLLRLHQARDLLIADERVATVAGKVGYRSASHFTRDFKVTFGLSPVSYARNYRRGSAG